MNIQKMKWSFAPFKLPISSGKSHPLSNPFAPFSGDWFHSIVIGIVVLGIIFRLGNLAAKPYWEDEVYTSLLISGYEIETIETAVKGNLIPMDAIAKYQEVRLGQSWKDTSVALAKRPEHTPLYFLLARAWAECFGSSVTAMRAFPAVSSLLTLPLFYWLARLLFGSAETAAVTLCLACTSPILIRYAQDARPYSLWVVGILLSSAMLLHSLRYRQRRNWVIYSASVAFAILTHWLSSFVFLAHGIYVFVTEYGFSRAKPIAAESITAESITAESITAESITVEPTARDWQTLKYFLIALTVGFLPVVPWAGLVIHGRYSVHAVLSWLEEEETLSGLLVKWLGNIGHLIFAWLPSDNSYLLFVGPLLLLLIGSTIWLVTKRPVKQWLLPVLLCVIPTVAFGMPDLLFGGTRSLISRYFLPVDVGALLILGFGLGASSLPAKNAINGSFSPRRILFYAVLTISLSACWFNLNADNWWGESDFSRQAANTVTQTSSVAEVYSDQRLSPFLAFSLSLRPTDYMIWLDSTEPLPDEMFDNTRTAFLFEPSDRLMSRVNAESAKRGVEVALLQSDAQAKGSSSRLFQIGEQKP